MKNRGFKGEIRKKQMRTRGRSEYGDCKKRGGMVDY